MKALDNKALDNVKLSQNIFEANLMSLISIFEDSLDIRERKVRELDDRIEEWSIENTGKSPSQIEELSTDWFQDYNHYKHHFDYLLLHSLFLSSFSLFENHLKRIAEIMSSYSIIKPNDIRGNGEIDTLRKYLSLVIGLNSASSDKKEWEELLDYKAVRNALVHSGAILNKELKKDLHKVRGFKKIKEHGVWYSGDSVYFRIKTDEFLKGFSLLSIEYSKNICNEIIQRFSMAPPKVTSDSC